MLRANLRMLRDAGCLDERGVIAINEAFGTPCANSRAGLDGPERARLIAELVPATLSPRAPLLLCGADLHLLIALDGALRPAERAGGGSFRQRVLVVEPDASLLCDSLSRVDLFGLGFEAERFVVFAGTAWCSELEQWLRGRIDLALPSAVVDAGGGHAILSEARQLLSGLRAEQGEILATLKRTTETGDTPGARDALAARAVLREASDAGRTLSVLLCGSRYTTYVRHSLEGLAQGLQALGHRAEILLEPDDSSVLTQLAYRRAIEACRPDLIVTVNYPRVLLNGALPEAIPHVCWIQDSMPHLLDEQVGKSVGETEFFIGNALPELAMTFGYPRHAMVSSCVPASEHRFHPGPVDESTRARLACDVAFVSHHSETPEAMRDRLIREMGGEAQGRTIVAALWESMPALLNESARAPLSTSVDRAVREQVAIALGHELTAAQCSMIRHRVALPLLGRMFRHEALLWAASICARRGWSFRLHGNGWERTPGLAAHAAGPIEHGEPLRACYQTAGVHLHLDPNTLTHQRVFECAMSGGLPIARFHHDALNPLLIGAADEACDDGAEQWPAVPLGRRYLAACDELGIEPMPCATAVASMPRIGPLKRGQIVRVFDPHWLYNGLGDVTFHDEPSLERVLERAIEDDDWRAERSASMRARMIESVGMRAFARHMLDAAGPIIGWKSACIRDGYGWPPRADWAEHARRKEAADAA